MRPGLVALLAIVLAAACGEGRAPSGEVEVTVFGAASLAAALDRITPAFEAAHPGTHVVVSTGSSAALRAQIEQGAPADVFLSADTANPEALRDEDLVDGDIVPFAANELALVVPARPPGGAIAIRAPVDLAGDGVRIVAAGEDVPISHYAASVVERLASLPGYPADFAARYAANVATREDSVAAVVAKLALGEGDAGFVYATDAAASDAVRRVPMPDDVNVRAPYAGVVLESAADHDGARLFLGFLTSSAAQAVLAELGFGPP